MQRLISFGAVAHDLRARVGTRRVMARELVVGAMSMAAVALGVGCDFSSFTEPATATKCSAIGARCQLADGPIGICLARPCPAGEVSPCFVCTPQH